MALKNKLLFLSLLTNIACLGLAIYLFNHNNHNTHASPPSPSLTKNKSIAVLTPANHPSLQKIEEYFIKTIKQKDKFCKISTYNANNNRTLLRSQAEEIIQQKPDLILSIATGPTKLLLELLVKKGITIPLVGAAIDDPQKMGITQSKTSPVTGITDLEDYHKTVAMLKFLYPALQTVLLVYDPNQGGGRQADKEALTTLFLKEGITLKSLEIFNTNEIYHKTYPLIQDMQAVIVLKDNTVVSGLDSIIKLCNQQRIPLITHDLDSVDRGASLGFGVYEESFGIQAAQQAIDILYAKKEAYQVPFAKVEQQKIKFNKNAILLQHFPINEKLLLLAAEGEVK